VESIFVDREVELAWLEDLYKRGGSACCFVWEEAPREDRLSS